MRLNAFGSRRDEFRRCQKFRSRTPHSIGYTNAAAAEFAREQENQ